MNNTLNEDIKIIKDAKITSPKGYMAVGIHSGIKKVKKDLAIIYSKEPTGCAGE